MSVDERRKYLRLMQPSYRKANKHERGQMLTHMEVATDLDRKTLVRLLQTDLERHPRQTPRQRTYGADIDDALRIQPLRLDKRAATPYNAGASPPYPQVQP